MALENDPLCNYVSTYPSDDTEKMTFLTCNPTKPLLISEIDTMLTNQVKLEEEMFDDLYMELDASSIGGRYNYIRLIDVFRENGLSHQ